MVVVEKESQTCSFIHSCIRLLILDLLIERLLFVKHQDKCKKWIKHSSTLKRLTVYEKNDMKNNRFNKVLWVPESKSLQDVMAFSLFHLERDLSRMSQVSTMITNCFLPLKS